MSGAQGGVLLSKSGTFRCGPASACNRGATHHTMLHAYFSIRCVLCPAAVRAQGLCDSELVMLTLSSAAGRRGGSPLRWTGTGSFPVNGVVHQGTSLQHLKRSLGTRQRQHKAVLGQQAEMGTRQTGPSETTLQLWRTADAVCFDVDSTFCSDESIDEVARFLGLYQDVKRITDHAMEGDMPFEVALRKRLELMKPSQDAFARFMADHPAKLSDGIEDLVRRLQARRVAVYLISGGFRIIIHPIADSLGIPVPSNVFANAILFNDDGSYRTFDEKEYTSRAGGKAEAIEYIKKQNGHKVVVMIGDGATDLEARRDGAADIFIGYGGSVYRDNIADAADWYVTSIKALTAELD